MSDPLVSPAELENALLGKHRAAELLRKAEARLIQLRYRLNEVQAREIGMYIKEALQACDD